MSTENFRTADQVLHVIDSYWLDFRISIYCHSDSCIWIQTTIYCVTLSVICYEPD